MLRSLRALPLFRLPYLARLDLSNNQIGGPGMASFSDAIARGAMSSLQTQAVCG